MQKYTVWFIIGGDSDLVTVKVGGGLDIKLDR